MVHTLRSIPENLRNKWKSQAALLGLTMDQFAFLAIDYYINKVQKDEKDLQKILNRINSLSQKKYE